MPMHGRGVCLTLFGLAIVEGRTPFALMTRFRGAPPPRHWQPTAEGLARSAAYGDRLLEDPKRLTREQSAAALGVSQEAVEWSPSASSSYQSRSLIQAWA